MAKKLKWTPEEDRIIIENFARLGRKVNALLPGRTEEACVHRAREYGLSREGNYSRWTQEEDKILVENYITQGGEVYKLLPGRSRDACMRRAVCIGVAQKASGDWTSAEIEILTKNYKQLGTNIPELQGTRNKTAIALKAARLGLTYADGAWSDDEDRLLIERYYENGTEIPELLKIRSRAAIRNRAIKLGIKRKAAWTEEEDAALIQAYKQGIAPKIFGKDTKSIRNRAYILGLRSISYRGVAKRKDVALAHNLPGEFVALRCRQCGRDYIMRMDDAVGFSHAMCSRLRPMPDGWGTCRKLDELSKSKFRKSQRKQVK